MENLQLKIAQLASILDLQPDTADFDEIVVRVNSLQSEVSSLKSKVATMEVLLGDMQKKLIHTRQLMIVRQLATAYQFRTAHVLGVGRVTRQYYMTHEQIAVENS